MLSIILTVCLYFSYQYSLVYANQLVKVPIASTYLSSGHQISEEDITIIEIAQYMIQDNMVLNEEDLIGKYIGSYHAFAKGSFFYEELIVMDQDVKESNNFNLQEGEVAIFVDVDMKTTYANSIKQGHLIDIYFQGYATFEEDNEKKVLYGPLVNGARVIGVRDSKGQLIDQDEDGIPSVIILALNYEDADLVQRAKFFGEVMPIISYATLNQEEEHYYDIAKMSDILYQRSIDVVLIEGNIYEE